VSTEIEIALIAAGASLVASLGTQGLLFWLSGRREDERWKQEQQRQSEEWDHERQRQQEAWAQERDASWFEKRREAYLDCLNAARKVVEEVQPVTIDLRGGSLEPANQAVLDFFYMPTSTLAFIAPEEAYQLSLKLRGSASNVLHLLAQSRIHSRLEAEDKAEQEVERMKGIFEQLRFRLRQEIGSEKGEISR
jgi:hypothetical protein